MLFRSLAVALLFYSYLNDKEDGFLEANGYSREEIGAGLRALISRYGLNGIADAFLEEL